MQRRSSEASTALAEPCRQSSGFTFWNASLRTSNLRLKNEEQEEEKKAPGAPRGAAAHRRRGRGAAGAAAATAAARFAGRRRAV